MDAEPDIAAVRTMLEAIGFTISADTAISNQQGINRFSDMKAMSDDGQSMRQDEHLVAVARQPIVGKDGLLINARAQELFNLVVYYVWICNKTSRYPSLASMTTAGLRNLHPHIVIEKASLEVDVGQIPKYNGREIPKMFEETREYLNRLDSTSVHHP